MRHIDVSNKVFDIIKQMYQNTEHAVLTDGKLIDWFEVKVGV